METRCAEDGREVDFENYFQQINSPEDKWLVAGYKAVQRLCALLKDAQETFKTFFAVPPVF